MLLAIALHLVKRGSGIGGYYADGLVGAIRQKQRGVSGRGDGMPSSEAWRLATLPFPRVMMGE